jgi:mitochondrial splicing suppressor protein 51
MMPPWWAPEAKRDCIAMASDRNSGSYLGQALGKADIQEKYGDDMMPLKLRVLAEKAYGRRIMG